MAQANAGGVVPNGAVPQVVGAAPVVNGAVLPQFVGTGVRAAGQAVAPVAGPPVAPVAGDFFPQVPVPARFDVDGALLGPLPTKSNGNCEILPKIAEETGP